MEENMLVIDGFLESGVFIPERPLTNIKGRQRASLHIIQDDENQGQLTAWNEFSQSIKASDEVLEGEPDRLRFKTLEEMTSL
jgi:hypothetical protein